MQPGEVGGWFDGRIYDQLGDGMTRVEGGVVVRAGHDGLAIAGCPSLDPSTRLRVSGPSGKWIYARDASNRLGGRNDG